jgi:hypothetical protein
MSNSLALQDQSSVIESVVIGGDLSKLTPQQRVGYYQGVCKSLGLNPLTKPFDYITLNNKLTLYARKDAADQLRNIHKISIEKPDIRFEDEWIIVTVVAHDGNGRTDSDVGAVNKKDMRGDFGNALMKAVTKAKRRVTLSICGLGMLDETEVETIPGAKPVPVDIETGEVVTVEAVSSPAETPAPAEKSVNINIRPYPPSMVKEGIEKKAEKHKEFIPTPAQENLLRYGLELCFAGQPSETATDKRHTLLGYLTGNTSTKKVSGRMFKAIVEDWLKMAQDEGGEYHIDAMAAKEAQYIVTAAIVGEGQQAFV